MNVRLATLLLSVAALAFSTATSLPVVCNCAAAMPLTNDCKLICSGQTTPSPPVMDTQLPGAPTNATALPKCNCAFAGPLTAECKSICSSATPSPVEAAALDGNATAAIESSVTDANETEMETETPCPVFDEPAFTEEQTLLSCTTLCADDMFHKNECLRACATATTLLPTPVATTTASTMELLGGHESSLAPSGGDDLQPVGGHAVGLAEAVPSPTPFPSTKRKDCKAL